MEGAVTMILTDLLSEEEWNDFVKDLHEKFGICCSVSDTEGAHVSHYENFCNRICPVIKQKPESIGAICAVAAQNFTSETKTTRKPMIGECDIALVKVAAPIFVGDTFLGTAGGCGLLPEDGEVEEFMVQKSTGLEEEKIAELADGIEVMSETRAREFADYITARIAEVVSRYESK
ncbi:MAG: PocR ligand-binding domain-containing protein [Deltaproteobacteria bacterium]|jgi:ligand-binding sensor protein|nr:PocR ligand-binding domain-containing protein [Deltaproteobacteria bacterium]